LTATEGVEANIIEPFDPGKHDRAAFSCGVEQVNNYFKKTANRLKKADNVSIYVMVTPDGQVVGFYALNAHSIDYSELPAKYRKTRPSHGNIPAAYISMIGRDVKFKDGGYGAALLIDAMKRIAGAADQIGIAVIMLDVLDCGDAGRTQRRKELYESYGFKSLVSNPLRLFLPMATVKTLITEELT